MSSVSMGMFGYFDEVYQALREVRRVLRPGGTFIMSVRNPYNLYLADLGRLPFRALGRLGRALRSRTRRVSAVLAARPGAAAVEPFRIAIHEDLSALIVGVSAPRVFAGGIRWTGLRACHVFRQGTSARPALHRPQRQA